MSHRSDLEMIDNIVGFALSDEPLQEQIAREAFSNPEVMRRLEEKLLKLVKKFNEDAETLKEASLLRKKIGRYQA